MISITNKLKLLFDHKLSFDKQCAFFREIIPEEVEGKDLFEAVEFY